MFIRLYLKLLIILLEKTFNFFIDFALAAPYGIILLIVIYIFRDLIKEIFKSLLTRRKQVNIPTMQLEDFISNSIIHLCNGIQKAQDHLHPIAAEKDENVKKLFLPSVVPHTLCSSDIPDHRKNLYLIEYDLSITVEDKQEAAKEGGISVIGSNLNLKYSSSNHQVNTSVSRMKFSIPIKYPSTPNPLQF